MYSYKVYAIRLLYFWKNAIFPLIFNFHRLIYSYFILDL
jgi:hypothetical protein